MIRYGDKIRLTAKDQKLWAPFNYGQPLKVKTAKEFNAFIERQIKSRFPGDSPEERFNRAILRRYKITE